MSSWANVLKKNIDKKPKNTLSKNIHLKKLDIYTELTNSPLNRFLQKHESDIEDILFLLEDICNSLCVNILDKKSKHYYTDFVEMIINNIYLDKYIETNIEDDSEDETDCMLYDI